MLFEVNANNNSINSQRNLRRVNNLLSLAVSSLSTGMKTAQSDDDSAGMGVSEKYDKALRKLKFPLQQSSDVDISKLSDQILLTPSGLARMGALFGGLLPSETKSPEDAAGGVYLTRQAIVENPEKALRSQANQSYKSVFKLLE